MNSQPNVSFFNFRSSKTLILISDPYLDSTPNSRVSCLVGQLEQTVDIVLLILDQLSQQLVVRFHLLRVESQLFQLHRISCCELLSRVPLPDDVTVVFDDGCSQRNSWLAAVPVWPRVRGPEVVASTLLQFRKQFMPEYRNMRGDK
jgi:hypothetical protein